jgi:hypothetical protein
MEWRMDFFLDNISRGFFDGFFGYSTPMGLASDQTKTLLAPNNELT